MPTVATQGCAIIISGCPPDLQMFTAPPPNPIHPPPPPACRNAGVGAKRKQAAGAAPAPAPAAKKTKVQRAAAVASPSASASASASGARDDALPESGGRDGGVTSAPGAWVELCRGIGLGLDGGLTSSGA